MDPKRKFWLFRQSKHFCAVPWNHFEVWTNGEVRTCSMGQSFGNINSQTLDNILQSDKIKSIKQDLLDDRLNSNCSGCHELTTPGEHYDLRNHYNPMFKSADIDYDNIDAFSLHGIDLHWDNTCNFKCIYCNPQQSSLIAQEQGLPVTRSDNDNIDKIINQIVSNQDHIKEIYFSGGEPLLVKHNARLLKQLTNTEIPLRINSNISMITESNIVFNEIKRFKNVLWTISADTIESRFEYIRHGSNWRTFLDNLSHLRSLGHGLRINLVWFVGSAFTLADTIKYFVANFNITDITINQLYGHDYLRVRNAPTTVKQSAKETIEQLLASGLIEQNSNSWYNISRCLRELDLPQEDSNGYKEYFDQLDALRGTEWRRQFPELV